jgi:hypothetical protein
VAIPAGAAAGTWTVSRLELWDNAGNHPVGHAVRQDDGFSIAGRATEVADPGVDRVVRGQVLAEREGAVWPGFDEEVVFELAMDRCLLMLTQAEGAFPAGSTIWRAAGTQAAVGDERSDRVT